MTPRSRAIVYTPKAPGAFGRRRRPRLTREGVPVSRDPWAPAISDAEQRARLRAAFGGRSAGGSSSTQIKPGQTLWGLAEKAYGSGQDWRRIAQANNITNPRTVQAGRQLTLPAPGTAGYRRPPTAAAPRGRVPRVFIPKPNAGITRPDWIQRERELRPGAMPQDVKLAPGGRTFLPKRRRRYVA